MGASFDDSRSPINTMPWGGVYLTGRVFFKEAIEYEIGTNFLSYINI
jgi:hypothetical protein